MRKSTACLSSFLMITIALSLFGFYACLSRAKYASSINDELVYMAQKNIREMKKIKQRSDLCNLNLNQVKAKLSSYDEMIKQRDAEVYEYEKNSDKLHAKINELQSNYRKCQQQLKQCTWSKPDFHENQTTDANRFLKRTLHELMMLSKPELLEILYFLIMQSDNITIPNLTTNQAKMKSTTTYTTETANKPLVSERRKIIQL